MIFCGLLLLTIWPFSRKEARKRFKKAGLAAMAISSKKNSFGKLPQLVEVVREKEPEKIPEPIPDIVEGFHDPNKIPGDPRILLLDILRDHF